MILKSVFSLLAVIFSYGVFCQDKILLISGREINCSVSKITDFEIIYFKPPENKERRIERDGVYAINYANGNTTFIYRPIPESDDELRYSYKEMRLFIMGEQDAKKGFRPVGSMVTSFVAGFAGSYLGLFYGPVVPAVFSFVVAIPQVKIQPRSISNPNYLLEDSYVQGYLKSAKNKKIQALVKGSIVGFVSGTTTFIFLYKK